MATRSMQSIPIKMMELGSINVGWEKLAVMGVATGAAIGGLMVVAGVAMGAAIGGLKAVAKGMGS